MNPEKSNDFAPNKKEKRVVSKHQASKRGHIHTHKLSKGQKAAQLFQAKKLWGNEILSQITNK